jgi:hypothetical protein
MSWSFQTHGTTTLFMALEPRHKWETIIYDLILRVDSFKSSFYIAQAIYHKTIWIFVKKRTGYTRMWCNYGGGLLDCHL